MKLEDAEKVSLARSAYDALNADQKRQLTESGVLDTLLTAENQISLLEREKEEAEKVAQQINSLPEVKDLKLADKTAVEAARKAYDALSDNQKAMIEDAKKALEEREAEIKRLQELAIESMSVFSLFSILDENPRVFAISFSAICVSSV